MFPLSPHNYFEIATLLVSIIFWPKLKETNFRWLLPFMIFIVAVEMYGRYLRNDLRQPNAWLYNYSIPVEYLFYATLFYLYHKKKSFKRISLGFMILFIVFVGINFLIQGHQKMNTNMLKVGSFCMIVLCCLVFMELLSSDKTVNYLKEPIFWIATGVLIFNTGEFLYTLFTDYLIRNHLDRTRKIFSSINNKLIWILYTCIIISILCIPKKPQKA
jgi:hypothetical protein